MSRDLIASLLSGLGILNLISLVLNNTNLRGPLIRAVNYHGTPKNTRDNLKKHFAYFKQKFSILSEADLIDFIEGKISLQRPGLLITFDDGLKSNYVIAADLLDELEIPGFFFLPVKFIELADNKKQAESFFLNNLNGNGYGSPLGEDFMPMSWVEVKDLKARGHAVGCHGYDHRALSAEITPQILFQEIVQSKSVLEEKLGDQVFSFCWPFGSPTSYSRSAYELICQHYRFGFTTFASAFYYRGNPYAVDRGNVEAFMDLPRVKFAVLGGAELYFRKRRRAFETLIGN